MPDLPLTSSLLPVLAASESLSRAEAQLQLSMVIAGVLSVFIFILVLTRKKMKDSDTLNVDWAKEEARLRQLAELTKAARGADAPKDRRDPLPQIPRQDRDPFDRVDAGVSHDPLPLIKPPPSPTESSTDAIIRGLHD